MKFLKSRGGAALITAVVVVFSIVFGTGRSLNAVRGDIWTVYDQGVNGDGHSVARDLEMRQATCSNLYTVAQRYLDPGAMGDFPRLLGELEHGDLWRSAELDASARLLIVQLQSMDLSDQDAQYVAGFLTELDSRAFSIAHDPYTEMAQAFNDRTLTAFPANLLHRVAGVETLPIFR